MRVHFAAALAIVVLGGQGCGSVPQHHVKHYSASGLSPETVFHVSYEDSNQLSFIGHVEQGEQDGSSTVLYPGDAGLAGLIVGIATHAAIESGSSSAKASAAQLAANEALEPIRHVLDRLTMQRAARKIIDSDRRLHAEPLPNSVVLSVNPMFIIDQSLTNLTLRNIVKLQPSEDEKGSLYQNMIEVVKPLPESVSSATDEELYRTFSELTDNMLSESISLAIRDASAEFSDRKVMKTFKFLDNGKFSYERASLIELSCERVVTRSLRKWLSSRPMTFFPDEPQGSC